MKVKVEERLKTEERKRRDKQVARSGRPTGDRTQLAFQCANCSRSFSRSGDMKRHKCDSVRSRKVVGWLRQLLTAIYKVKGVCASVPGGTIAH